MSSHVHSECEMFQMLAAARVVGGNHLEHSHHCPAFHCVPNPEMMHRVSAQTRLFSIPFVSSFMDRTAISRLTFRQLCAVPFLCMEELSRRCNINEPLVNAPVTFFFSNNPCTGVTLPPPEVTAAPAASEASVQAPSTPVQPSSPGTPEIGNMCSWICSVKCLYAA